jgi:hypothetical protein
MCLRRISITLTVIVVAISLAMLAATFLAQASSLHTGSIQWKQPQNVSDPENNDTDIESDPDIGVDSNGNIHVIWTQGASETTRDPCYSKLEGLAWSEIICQDTDRGSYDTALVVQDGNNKVHVTWRDRVDVGVDSYLYYSSISGGSWGSPELVTDTTTNLLDNMLAPTIALANGYIHLVWSQAQQGSGLDLYYSRRELGGGDWYTTTRIVDTATHSMYARMAPDVDGNLHVVWHEFDPAYEADDVIYYISGTVSTESTIWASTPISISEGVSEATTPDIVVGGDGTVHVAFGERKSTAEQYVWYVDFPIADPDSATPTIIPNSEVGILQIPPYYTHPSIALNGTDEVHIVWNGTMDGYFTDMIHHVLSDDQGTSWSGSVPVSDDGLPDRYPALAVGNNGIAHAVWQQKSVDDADIFYSRGFLFLTYIPLTLKNYP